MTRRNEDIYRTGFGQSGAINYQQTWRQSTQSTLDPDVQRARQSPGYVERSSRSGRTTTGAPRYPIRDTDSQLRRNTSTKTGQQQQRRTGSTTSGDEMYASSRVVRQKTSAQTEKLPRLHHKRNFALTIVGMTMICMLCAGIILANITAAWQNSQDSSYFTQTTHRDYTEVGNNQAWAFMAGNNIDVLIIKSNDISKSHIMVVAEVTKDAGKTNLELVPSHDGKSVLLTANGEHVGGLTFEPSQDTHTWSIDVEKEAVKK